MITKIKNCALSIVHCALFNCALCIVNCALMFFLQRYA